jgi:NAD+ diphosphatase
MQTSNFISRVLPPADEPSPACWFVFQGDNLLVMTDGDGARVPMAVSLAELGLEPVRQLYLGYLQDQEGGRIDCYAVEIASGVPVPTGLTAEGLRPLAASLSQIFFGLAGRAIQILTWDRTHQFCGQCGALTETLPDERAKRCPHCGLTNYPRLSPAIIIAVVRHSDGEGLPGKWVLLARNHRFPPGRFSVIAGFVEPGESLEECAQREVLEEVGIRIKDIRYFGSQPWPFPNSLMIGFTAEYESGEIRLEEAELAEARWFPANRLPDLPPKTTIARRLIDWFVDGARSQS